MLIHVVSGAGERIDITVAEVVGIVRVQTSVTTKRKSSYYPMAAWESSPVDALELRLRQTAVHKCPSQGLCMDDSLNPMLANRALE